MISETLEIISPGMLTTVQDLGRRGYQRFGVPVSGAMDSTALRIANILVGNPEDSAGLETTVMGPTIRFLVDTTIALTGANLGALLDGSPVEQWQAVPISANSILSFDGSRDGMRGYVSVGGGIEVPIIMGSRSTYLKGGFGGFEGRALREGDILSAFISLGPKSHVGIPLPAVLVPDSYGHNHKVRVVFGPQETSFSSEGLATFLSSEYSISIQSDRMGYRLEGPAIEHINGADIISDATSSGSIQVPGDGNPIILLADRGTTGGYTKIATVIDPDLSLLAQALPGDKLRFASVTPEKAREIVLDDEANINDIKTHVKWNESERFALAVDGKTHKIASTEREPITVDLASVGETTTVEASVGEFNFEIEVRYSE